MELYLTDIAESMAPPVQLYQEVEMVEMMEEGEMEERMEGVEMVDQHTFLPPHHTRQE